MRLPPAIKRCREILRLARVGLRVAGQAGLDATFSPRAGLRFARAVRAHKRAGPWAVAHLHALLDPDRPALVSGATRLSYGEFDRRINRLAHGLHRLGAGPRDRVALMLRNGHEHLELSGALSCLGATAVQIGYRLKVKEIAYILQNSGARAVVFHAEFAEVIGDALAEAKQAGTALPPEACVMAPGQDGRLPKASGFPLYEQLLDGGSPDEPPYPAEGGYGGTMVYTSGTTGKAKGAHRDFKTMGVGPILGFVSELPFAHDERHLVICPLYHSAAPAFAGFTFLVGGCSIILDQFDPERVLRTIEWERITSALMVPTMLGRLTQLGASALRRYDLSSLRFLVSGAAPLPTALAERVEDLFGPILYNFYGATETGLVTLAKPGEHTARPGTIGRLVLGNEARLLDESGRDVPEGDVGELYVRNSMVVAGYHRNEEATRSAQRDGFFSVGDLARRDRDGYYYLVDRKSDMVISGGVNIYPFEIEQRLHQHPAVLEAAVVGVPDPDWGESLAAFVVFRPRTSATAEELGLFIAAELADFKRPRHVIVLDALPRNPTGKVLKRELRARLEAPRGS